MGTEISLDIAGLSVDWSKNRRGVDHGFLFQEDDRRRVPWKDEDHDDDPNQALMEMAFTRPLDTVLPRLELLGHTLATARVDYERVAAVCAEDRRSFREEGIGEELPLELMSFREFKEFVTRDPISDLDDSYSGDMSEDGERRMRGRFADNAITDRVPTTEAYDGVAYSERSYFGSLIGFLHPYNALRLLAENEGNLHADLEWRYGPLVCAGWAMEGDFVPEVRREQTFLIATEGTSDTHIIKHAVSLLRPEIADFFRFVDVSKRYPFTGTGNLVRFAQGLTKIDVHNQLLFVLDNDAEGVSAHRRISELELPANMRAAPLPELKRFRNFRTRGPDGTGKADINGRAAAIECYLDLTTGKNPPAQVIWTAYKEDLSVYQGELESKETYTKTFLKRAPKIKGYDMSGLTAVLDMIFAECCAIAETGYSSRTTALR
ncbi:MAG: HEPN/Toprim-associated domain-containing protein [Rhodospirillales bacterium]|nr:HEPN/Toprim-associated domain-containing protein [Rhodospirillales bacterium]